jgi:hypothetical protein
MDTWRTQPITETTPILLFDGVWGHVIQPTGAVLIEQSGH